MKGLVRYVQYGHIPGEDADALMVVTSVGRGRLKAPRITTLGPEAEAVT